MAELLYDTLTDCLPVLLAGYTLLVYFNTCEPQWVPTLTQPGIKELTERDTETDTGVRL